jgi:hypothetical protein
MRWICNYWPPGSVSGSGSGSLPFYQNVKNISEKKSIFEMKKIVIIYRYDPGTYFKKTFFKQQQKCSIGSGSVIPDYGSVDPVPSERFTEPGHCNLFRWGKKGQFKGKAPVKCGKRGQFKGKALTKCGEKGTVLRESTCKMWEKGDSLKGKHLQNVWGRPDPCWEPAVAHGSILHYPARELHTPLLHSYQRVSLILKIISSLYKLNSETAG